MVSVATNDRTLELSTHFGHRQAKCGCLERQTVTYYVDILCLNFKFTLKMITKQKSDIRRLAPFGWVSFLLLVLCFVALLPLFVTFFCFSS